MDHPNIEKILDFHLSDKKFYIITDFCSEGLFDEIKKRSFSDTEAVYAIYQI